MIANKDITDYIEKLPIHMGETVYLVGESCYDITDPDYECIFKTGEINYIKLDIKPTGIDIVINVGNPGYFKFTLDMLNKIVFTDYNEAVELYRSKQSAREKFLKEDREKKLNAINNMTNNQILNIISKCVSGKCDGCPIRGAVEYTDEQCDEFIMDKLKERLRKDSSNESE